MSAIRVGVDVGGTFTKAVALEAHPLALLHHEVVPTSHGAAGGVSEGVAAALRALLEGLGDRRGEVELVAYSTTQAMNALLEGDVARVGVVGIGAEPELRRARKRTRVGDVKLAPGPGAAHRARLPRRDARPRRGAVAAALDGLKAAGCTAVAVSGAFAVDAPEQERTVAEAARERGLPVCAGHELSGAYGLETRTISAAINASILPLVERTAQIVEGVLHEAGVDVPLLVLRGDGGAMSLDGFRQGPSFTIGSGPAAGVAAALHQLSLTDGIVLECGGTSSNVSVVKHGRTVLRTLRVMGRPTSLRSVDSWVVGAAGGSMARIGRRRVEETGPRSAHVAGLPYACFAAAEDIDGAALELLAPRPGDPEYAVLRTASGQHVALTATCAAHALGLVDGDRGAVALAAFGPLAQRLRCTPEQAARGVMDAAVAKIAGAVAEAARAHDFGPEVPVVALGGAGPALAGEVARALGRPLVTPAHPEILSSIGAALSLVRAEIARHCSGPGATLQLAHDAQRACVDAGAAPADGARRDPLRGRAAGCCARSRPAPSRSSPAPRAASPPTRAAQLRAAAAALGIDAGRLHEIAVNDYYRVFSEDGAGAVAVVDGMGSVALAEHAKRVVCGAGGRARGAAARGARRGRREPRRGDAAAAGRGRLRRARRRPVRGAARRRRSSPAPRACSPARTARRSPSSGRRLPR